MCDSHYHKEWKAEITGVMTKRENRRVWKRVMNNISAERQESETLERRYRR